jgi:hypothetical protein
MLRRMRRSHIWLLIAALWLLITVFTTLRHGWKQAWLQAVIALLFLGVGLYSRYQERVR